MWVFALEGFVSVVEFRGKPERLIVRGRIRTDVEAWRRLVGERTKIVATAWADYPWRFTTSRKKFSNAMVRLVDGVRYPNFKSAVGHDDPARASAYMGVWAEMHALGKR